jgi:hypothetical protein
VLLVTVDDLDFNGLAEIGIPHETDTPLIIDANRPLPLAIAMKRFQAPSWHRGEVPQ